MFRYLMFLSILFTSGSFADERIKSFHSDITVLSDGSLEVVETIKVESLGVNIRRGIFRDLPTKYPHPKFSKLGFNSIAPITVLSVIRNNKEEVWHSEMLDNGLRIYIGAAGVVLPNGDHTYELRYRAERQIVGLGDHAQLTWNVTGNNWRFPINQASANVILPNGTKAVDQSAWTGAFGATSSNATIKGLDTNISNFVTTRKLARQQGLTVQVGFSSKGLSLVNIDEVTTVIQDNPQLVIGYGLLLLMPIVLLLFWLWKGIDPSRGTIVAQYRPLDGLSAAAHRAVSLNKVDDTSFAVASLSLAVKGWITISETAKGSYRLIRKSEFGGQSLSPSEKILFNGLFIDRESIEMGVGYNHEVANLKFKFERFLRKEFAATSHQNHLLYLTVGVLLGLTGLGVILYSLPAEMLSRFMVIALVSAVIGFVIIWIISLIVKLPNDISLAVLAITIAIGCHFFGVQWHAIPFSLFGISIGIFGYLMPAPKKAAGEKMDYIEGFRLYLAKAEHESLKRLDLPTKTPQLYEDLLPFAIALDLETQWSEQFANILCEARASGEYDEIHSWYSGSTSDTSRLLAPALATGLASSVMATSRAPSSSSGGGGFSGGGGGGGGGGGW